MRVRPVSSYKVPSYPTRLVVNENPDELIRHAPKSWKAIGEFSSIVALLAAASGCMNSNAQGAAPAAGPQVTTPALTSAKRVPPNRGGRNAAVVAPIFNHGEGQGGTGCVSVAPPVFLSEEEAIQVITDELRSVGIQSYRQNVDWPEVKIAPRTYEFDPKKMKGKEIEGKPQTFNVDLIDDKKNVRIEFISRQDYVPLGGISTPDLSVQGYDCKEIAQRAADKVQAQAKGTYFASFYDPIYRLEDMNAYRDAYESWEAEWMKNHPKPTDREEWQEFIKFLNEKEKVFTDKIAEESKRLLRLQVKDFIDWLKGQGII